MKGFSLYLFRSFKDLLTTITTIILINISPKNTIDRIVSYNTGDDSRSIGNVTAKSITDIIGATNILYIFIQRTLCSFAPFLHCIYALNCKATWIIYGIVKRVRGTRCPTTML